VNKTSVYLSSEESMRLASLAQREGTSQAEIIRRAIRTYVPQRHADRNFSLARLARASTGPGDSVANLTEAELMDGFGS
jgi:predicted DNA-binding protein